MNREWGRAITLAGRLLLAWCLAFLPLAHAAMDLPAAVPVSATPSSVPCHMAATLPMDMDHPASHAGHTPVEAGAQADSAGDASHAGCAGGPGAHGCCAIHLLPALSPAIPHPAGGDRPGTTPALAADHLSPPLTPPPRA